jgi:hypothetical protein
MTQQQREPPRSAHRLDRWRELQGDLTRRDSVWAAQLVAVCAITLDLALPNKLTIGPFWLLPAVEATLLFGVVGTGSHPGLRHSRWRRRIALSLIALVSVVNVVSLILLVHFLLHGGKAGGRPLIFSGIALWGTNVLLFGLWYWELDRGGPAERARRTRAMPDFLFPQMSDAAHLVGPGWMPGLIDYLYVSLTNSAAFSPTDAMPLTATAKLLMGVQSLVSILIVVLVVARAVNILA